MPLTGQQTLPSAAIPHAFQSRAGLARWALAGLCCWWCLCGVTTVAFAQVSGLQNGFLQPEPFDVWDRNRDGWLSKEELPPVLRERFADLDGDGNGQITREEDAAFHRRFPRWGTPAGDEKRAADEPGRRELSKNVRQLRDVPYVENGHVRQKLDLYLLPTAAQPRALVVYVHGGAWRAGDKGGVEVRPLLEAGLSVASINYRLTGSDPFPAQIEDCKAAIRFLRAHATDYGIDPDRIGVWGASAGGHLVALLGTTGDVTALEGSLGSVGVSSRVQAVCDWFGPTDLTTMGAQSGPNSRIDHDAANSPESLLIGGPVQERREAALAASPISYVSADDPPFFIVHGSADDLVPLAQSQTFAKALAESGVKVELRVVENAGHGGFKDPTVMETTVRFFRQTLRRADAPAAGTNQRAE